MANRLSHDKRKMVLRMLCEGCSIRSVERLTGVHRDTIGKAILSFGNGCRNFMDEAFRGLKLEHIEVDEIWTFVQKKQGRLTVQEKASRHDIGDVYLWTCLDKDTKLVPSFKLGKRSADNARKLMTDLAGRLDLPKPHASDSHAYKLGGYVPVVQLSTDGFAAYPEAVDLAFGPYVHYGQIIKDYRNADQPGRYAPPEMVATERRTIKNMQDHERRSICTSHVERHNLTIRTFMKRFARLSLGFSKKLECLEAACAMFLAYYNFIWRTRYPDNSGQSGRKRPTAAMMANVTDHLWNFDELYETVLYYE